MSLLVDKLTKTEMEQAINGRGGSYLLVGPQSSGKYFAAHDLAVDILKNDHFLLVIEPEKNSIGISKIQALKKQLELKTARGAKRVVLIRDGDLMTTEAQNALLKTLEETPRNVCIIITAASRDDLLLTILSRVTQLRFRGPSRAQITNYLQVHYKLTEKRAEEFTELSHGCVGKACSYVQDKSEYDSTKNIDGLTVKLLSNDYSYYQLLKLMQDSIETESLPQLIDSLVRYLRQKMREAAQSGNMSEVEKLNRRLRTFLQMRRYLKANGNFKLAASQLILSS